MLDLKKVAILIHDLLCSVFNVLWMYFLSSVGRNGSGKSNFFFGKFCILVTCTLYSSTCMCTRADLNSNTLLYATSFDKYLTQMNLAFTKLQLTIQYILTQTGKSSCVKLILL